MKKIGLKKIIPMLVLLLVFVLASCVNVEEQTQKVTRLNDLGQMGTLSEDGNAFDINDEGYGFITVAVRAETLEKNMVDHYSLLMDGVQFDFSKIIPGEKGIYTTSIPNVRGDYSFEEVKMAEVKTGLPVAAKLTARAGESIETLLLSDTSEATFMELEPTTYADAKITGLIPDSMSVKYIKTNEGHYFSVSDYLFRRMQADGNVEEAVAALEDNDSQVSIDSSKVTKYVINNGELVPDAITVVSSEALSETTIEVTFSDTVVQTYTVAPLPENTPAQRTVEYLGHQYTVTVTWEVEDVLVLVNNKPDIPLHPLYC